MKKNPPACPEGNSQATQRLQKAAQRNDIAAMERALSRGAEIHFKNDEALFAAASRGHTRAVRWLMERGANAAAENSRAAFEAAHGGSRQIVELLVSKGADPKALKVLKDFELYAAIVSDDTAKLVSLIKGGIDLREHGDFALCAAAVTGNAAAADILLDEGVFLFDRLDVALECASEHGKNAVIRVLLDHEEELPMPIDRSRAIGAVLRESRSNTLELLLRDGMELGAPAFAGLNPPLKPGQVEMLQCLAQIGVIVPENLLRQPRTRTQFGTSLRFAHRVGLGEELAGYVEIGMRVDALNLVRHILASERIAPEDFSEAVRAVGVISNHQKWKPIIETAYERQSLRTKRKTRVCMLLFYWALNDWQNAFRFISIRSLREPPALLAAMDTLIELDEPGRARRIATKCKAALKKAPDCFDRACLIEALARYCARCGDWSEAYALWQDAPRNEPFAINASIGMVELYVMKAMQVLQSELRLLETSRPAGDLEISLPGNEQGRIEDARRVLLKLKSGLKRIVPLDRQKKLGFDPK